MKEWWPSDSWTSRQNSRGGANANSSSCRDVTGSTERCTVRPAVPPRDIDSASKVRRHWQAMFCYTTPPSTVLKTKVLQR